MKKLIAVVMLLSLSVCAISSCEDQTEEFDTIQNQQIEDVDSTRDGSETSENDPE